MVNEDIELGLCPNVIPTTLHIFVFTNKSSGAQRKSVRSTPSRGTRQLQQFVNSWAAMQLGRKSRNSQHTYQSSAYIVLIR